MDQAGYLYLLLIFLIFSSALYLGKLIQIRIKRNVLLEKYKPGSIQHGNIQKMLKPKQLIATVLALLISVALLVVAVLSFGHIRNFIIILIFATIVLAISLAITPSLLKQYER